MIDTTTTRPDSATHLRWARRLLAAEAIFQIVVAALAYLQRSQFVAALDGSSLAPNHKAAVATFHGSLAIHLVLAAVFALGAVRLPIMTPRGRLRLTVPLVVTAVVGVAAMWLPVQTWLSPIGVVIALATLAALWLPASNGTRG